MEVKETLRILKNRVGTRFHICVGEWLDIGNIKGVLSEKQLM